MTVKTLVQEAMSKNALEFEVAMKEELRSRVASVLEAKMKNEGIEVFNEQGLWDNIHAKRKRIKAGSGEHMRKPGSKGAPTAQDFKNASANE